MAKSRASKEQYSKITHNTLAFEEAIMASVRTAALPAQQALAQARYDQAKALLLKVVAYFIAALGIFIVLWLFLELAKYAYGGWTKRTVPTPTVIQTENIIKDETVSTEKEIELRSIVNRTIEEEQSSNSKSNRPITANSKRTVKDIINPNSRIGKIIDDRLTAQRKTQEEVITKTEVIENMVVGPEVQTLTVFNQKDVQLRNGTSVSLVAGHRYSNNSSTNKWREGYCYVSFRNQEIEVRIDLSTKAGDTAAAMDTYLSTKEFAILGG